MLKFLSKFWVRFQLLIVRCSEVESVGLRAEFILHSSFRLLTSKVWTGVRVV